MASSPPNGSSKGRRKALLWAAGVAALGLSAVLVARALDLATLANTARAALADPLGAGVALLLYAAAFALRAALWSRVLPRLSFGHALAGLHLSLAGNHILPFRLGEALRVTSVVRRTPVGFAAAAASTVMLRGADVLAVVGLAALFGSRLVSDLLGAWGWALAGASVTAWSVGLWWLRRLSSGRGVAPSASTGLVALGAAAAWVLESAVLWQAAKWAGLHLDYGQAVLVTAVTIAAQVVAVAPAGIGTYEAAGTAAFVAMGADAAPALAAAVIAHALKTAYALCAGTVASFLPSPGALGRLRLPPRPLTSRSSSPREASGGAAPHPIVFFVPAHNEAATVGDVIARAPTNVFGHPVLRIVVDDGSTDGTAEVAAAAGAHVVRSEKRQGLGAAVRIGLNEGAHRGAAAVVFCDADGEYRPEEMERVVAPILRDDADYVVGTRLKGDIEKMLPHRRLGNVVLTKLLSYLARANITDGQSGYRALSRETAAAAEIIHDFNYAQVLTLDLLAKGFRYLEVPITYRFRTSGRSFVRVGPYLRRVVPAVHREINDLAAADR